MKYRVLISLLLISNVSCGMRASFVDVRLLRYLERFEERFGVRYEGSLLVEESLPDMKQDAVCTQPFDGKKVYVNTTQSVIKVSERAMKVYVSESEMEQLVFHELGHCALGLKHDTKLKVFEDGNKAPASIMYPYTFGSIYKDVYVKYRDYYWKELVGE